MQTAISSAFDIGCPQEFLTLFDWRQIRGMDHPKKGGDAGNRWASPRVEEKIAIDVLRPIGGFIRSDRGNIPGCSVYFFIPFSGSVYSG
jgi:hypothetical protein